jgi:hypothetical protein
VWDDDARSGAFSQPLKKKIIVERFKPPPPAATAKAETSVPAPKAKQQQERKNKQAPSNAAPAPLSAEEELKWKSEKARRAKLNELSRNVEQRKRILASALSNMVRLLKVYHSFDLEVQTL